MDFALPWVALKLTLIGHFLGARVMGVWGALLGTRREHSYLVQQKNGVDLVVHIELLTFRKGLVAMVSRRALSHSFVFELDCQVVVMLVLNPLLTPCMFQNTLLECYYVFESKISWSITHISRSKNDATDALGRFRSKNSKFIKFI